MKTLRTIWTGVTVAWRLLAPADIAHLMIWSLLLSLGGLLWVAQAFLID